MQQVRESWVEMLGRTSVPVCASFCVQKIDRCSTDWLVCQREERSRLAFSVNES